MCRDTFCDEFGYLNLKPEQSNIFFKLMEERYRRHCTIITTNASSWSTTFQSLRALPPTLHHHHHELITHCSA